MPDYTLFDKEVDISKLNAVALISILENIEQMILKLQKKRDCIVKELKIRLREEEDKKVFPHFRDSKRI